MNRIMKSMLGVLLSGAMLLQTAEFTPMQTPDAAGTCSVNTNKTYQMIKGFGGINHREWTGYDLSDAEVQRAFGTGSGDLGMSILRIFVNDNSSQWNLAIPVAQKAQKLGATVFATPWNPPASMRSAGNGQPRGGMYVLNNGAEAQYAKHLNDFVKYCEGQGVNLYSISVQNEPDWSGEWTYWSPERAANFLAGYGKAVTQGTNALMMSPESFSYSKDYYNAILNNAQAFENCDIFGTHFYGTQRSAMDFPALESCGKDIWMTEVYVPDSKISCEAYPDSLEQCVNIHNGLVVGNMNAYVVWYIKRSYGPLNESGNVSKRGYCFGQYSKFVRPGDVRIDATEQPNSNILVSAYKHSPTQIEIVAINNGTGDMTQDFDIGGRAITGVNRYRTSANENWAETKGLNYSGSGFSAQLPGKSVSTFIVSLESDGVEVPDNPNQPVVIEPDEPDENGYYFHDTFENGTCDWEGRGGASAATASGNAYAGDKALSVTNREKQWNGAQKTINYKTFEAGKEYSFSVIAYSATEQTLMLSLQYTDASSGETKYDHIGQAVSNGGYVLISNPNYKIPEGASSPMLYVESDGTTGDFFIDEAIGAPAGTTVDGPKEIKFLLGDLDGDEKITGADLTLAKRGMLKNFANATQMKAADVDLSGKVDKDDIVWFVQYLTGQTKEFPEPVTPPVPAVNFQEMAQKFGSVNLAKSYKGENEHNPLISTYFGADPGVMEYDGRVYIYMTDDALLYENGNVTKNVYSKITHLRCISSDDLVNWTDHGLINAVGQNGAAKWAGNSWAPTACHKTINGKEKFFLYFANNANGIGVLTSDSPTGPWTDPIGKALINRQTANCTDVPWVFDPAVLVDDDGKGYLYFGGGTENKDSAHPKTARCVQLGDDMTSIVGTPREIDAPYMFEDSGIHKYNGKYYYSYCTNWSTSGNQYGLSTAAIDYMVSDSPLGPFTYAGEVFKNIGNFFGTTGNNHHTILEFKGQFYLFYHAQYLQDQMGLKDMGYRTTHIDKITVNADGSMKQVTGTKTGVDQIKKLDPFTSVRAATLSHQGGIQIAGSGNTTVSADKGDWFRVSGVDCKSASSITIKASSASGSIIKICTGSASGTAVSYIEVPAGGSMQEISAQVSGLSGVNDLYFVFNNTTSVDSWHLG